MKRILYFLLLCLSFAFHPATAQNSIFLSGGKIEFEKKVNLHSQIDDDDAWGDFERKNTPKFKTTYFDLYFSGNKTIYQPGRENPDNLKTMEWASIADQNVVYAELDSSRCVAQKKVFEQLFLIRDSTRKIQWKITDETRTIAGFQCRRANALIMDTIYVVAFYTDEIITPGGPESFSGLPGMILGVSLPHKHITWFATQVSAQPPANSVFKIPAKGKKASYATLKDEMKDVMKDWGAKFRQRNLEAMML